MKTNNDNTTVSGNRCGELEVISVSTCHELCERFGRPQRLSKKLGVWRRQAGSVIVYHRQREGEADTAIRLLLDQARNEGLEVRAVIVFVGSGAAKSRPDLEALTGLLSEDGVSGLLVRNFDRLSRDQETTKRILDEIDATGADLWMDGKRFDLKPDRNVLALAAQLAASDRERIRRHLAQAYERRQARR